MAAFIREHSEIRRSTSMRFCTTPLTKEPVESLSTLTALSRVKDRPLLVRHDYVGY